MTDEKSDSEFCPWGCGRVVSVRCVTCGKMLCRECREERGRCPKCLGVTVERHDLETPGVADTTRLLGYIGDLNKLVALLAPVLWFIAKHAVFQGVTDQGEIKNLRDLTYRLHGETKRFRPEATEGSASTGIRGRCFAVLAECASVVGCEKCGWLERGKCLVQDSEMVFVNRGGEPPIEHTVRFHFVREMDGDETIQVIKTSDS